jgi:hypothetical protein
MAFTSDEALGLGFLLSSLLCLGTWPALLRLCSMTPHSNSSNSSPATRVSSSLSPTPRNLCHVYMDYATTYFLISSVPLLVDLYHREKLLKLAETSASSFVPPQLIFVAMLGGSLLSLGNLSLQWATAVFDASLTTVLALQASLTVVLGTTLNYLLEPSQTARPRVLGVGVGVFLLAIGLATRAQIVYSQEKRWVRLRRNDSDWNTIEMEPPHHTSNIRKPTGSIAAKTNYGSELESSSLTNSETEHGDGTIFSDRNPVSICSTNKSLLPLSNEHTLALQKDYSLISKPMWGVVVATAGGLCFGFFSPCFNIAVNDPFNWRHLDDTNTDGTTPAYLATTAGLSVSRANFWFSLAFWMASALGNVVLLSWQQRSVSVYHVVLDYVAVDAAADRVWAWLAGVVCALGNVLQFQGGQRVGYATADLVQAYPLISTIWDIFLFGEFATVRMKSHLGCLLLGMYASYLAGIFLLAASSMQE